MNTFMGLPIPPHWVISQDFQTGNLSLYTPGGNHLDMAGLEVYRHIAQYWGNGKRETNEQYRRTSQALRSAAFAQSPAGNAGGAAQGNHPLASTHPTRLAPYQGALQGLGMAGAIPSGPPSGLGYNPAPGGMITVTVPHQIIAIPLPPEPLPREEARVGELIGHRAWVVDGGRLRSVSMGNEWLPGEPMCAGTNAGLEVGDHNNVGVWAFKDPYGLAFEFRSLIIYNPGYSYRPGIFGTVYLWGTIIEHEHGYRAQYASIRSLDKAAPDIDLEALRARYVSSILHTERG